MIFARFFVAVLLVFALCLNGLKGLVARLEAPARALDGNKRITLV